MRRIRPDLTYKRETADIMSSVYEPWQRGAKDPREGVHRLVNRSVSLGDEAISELDYIRAKFMPQSADITESHTLYDIAGYTPDSLRIGTVPLTSVYAETASIDRVLDGVYDEFVTFATYTTPAAFTDLCGHTGKTVYGLSDGTVYAYDLSDASHVIDASRSSSMVSFTFYADSTCRTLVIPEDADLSSLRVADADGMTHSIEILSHSTARGVYMPVFDRDGDGVIWYDDRDVVESIRNVKQSELTPERWAQICDLDYNDNLVVDDADLVPFDAAFGSLSDSIYAAARIISPVNGALTVSYSVKGSAIVAIDDNEDGYTSRTSLDPLNGYGKAIWYDKTLDAYLCLQDDQYLHIIKRGNFDSIANDHLVHLPLWNTRAEAIDLMVWNGYVWVLASDGHTHKLFCGDILKEQLFTTDIVFELSLPETPQACTFVTNGRILIAAGTKLIELQPKRYVYYYNGSHLYLSNRETVTDTDGKAVPVSTVKVFNSFDSFGYNIGLNRRWGVSNETFRDTIINAFMYPNSHSRIGMRNCMLREFGLHARYAESLQICRLPGPIDNTRPIYINGIQAVMSSFGDGIAITADGRVFHAMHTAGAGVPSLSFIECVTSHTDELTITLGASFIDGDGLSRVLSDVKLVFPPMHDDERITITPFTDPDALARAGYTDNSGMPTSTLYARMLVEDAAHPALFSNAVVNEWPLDFIRVPSCPIASTGYNPALSSIVTETDTITLS